MEVIKSSVPEIVILSPKIFVDSRGFFFESFHQKLFDEKVFETQFIQDNESKSSYGVLRGLHYQLKPYAQSKLVRVVQGRILDVAVDIRKDSPTYLSYVSVELSHENKKQLYIPRGFAHGFISLEDNTIVQYKCDNYYAPDYEGSIRYDDPNLKIDWGISPDKIKLSEKDKNAPFMVNAKVFNFDDRL